MSERSSETESEESQEDPENAEIGEVVANQKITYALFKAYMDWQTKNKAGVKVAVPIPPPVIVPVEQPAVVPSFGIGRSRFVRTGFIDTNKLIGEELEEDEVE